MRLSKSLTTIKILDAAYGLMWRQGFLRVSMDEIAERAGVTKRTLYQHFPRWTAPSKAIICLRGQELSGANKRH